jgi:hypothetical protein
LDVLGLRRDVGRMADGRAAGSETEVEGGKLVSSSGRRLGFGIASRCSKCSYLEMVSSIRLRDDRDWDIRQRARGGVQSRVLTELKGSRDRELGRLDST